MGLFNWGQRFAYFGLSSPIIVDVVSHSGKPWDSTGLLNQGQKFASPVQNCVLAKSSPKIKLSIRILRLSKTPILVTVYISMPCCTKFRGQEINLSIFVLQSLILDTLKCWTLPNSGLKCKNPVKYLTLPNMFSKIYCNFDKFRNSKA